jgi:hypothetical protein
LAELAVRGELAGLAAQEALAELAVRAGLAAQEALAELAGLVVQVVELELLIAPVAEQALAIVRAAGREPESAQVEAVPERDPVAVPPRTKPAIVAHHRGLVAVPRVEDSAAVAETTRAPAATEAAKAWEVAAIVAAVVVE